MSTTDLPGSSLLAGRYRLVERLGAGGMSVVWRGFDEVLGRQVAVKVLPPSTSADPSFRRRLRAEAQAAARLSHPHITNVYDYGEAQTADGEAVPYVVMELVDGESLAAVLARVRRLPWPAAVRICSEVSAALAAAHSRGIVHRDVTPANVMLTPSGAKVVDFGISALIGENDIDPDGSLLGTPAYLAPERLEGGQVNAATDVYAVGLLIYRTLIGQLPWDVGTTTALLRAHQYTEPDPLPPVEGLPVAVSSLIARCLEKHPDDRPSSAELAHVLAGVSAGAPAARGFVPEWNDSAEDTTILPTAYPFTDAVGQVRPGLAKVPEAAAGRGVASVPNQADPSTDAPVSPAPGLAVPVPMADVEAALAGRPVADQMQAVALAAPPAEAPARAPGRNNRFQAMGGGAALGGVAVPPGPSTPLRRAFNAPAEAARPSMPPPVAPQPDPGGGGSSGSGNDKTRRVLVMAGATLLVGAGVWAYAALGANQAQPQNRALPQPSLSVMNAAGKCVISYAVESDDKTTGRYTASVTIANRQNTALKTWDLWFMNQGDQVVNGGGKVQLQQTGKMVTVAGPAALGPQKAVTLNVTGRYTNNNTSPMVFRVNNEPCEAYVSGKPGEPSRPVVLQNGTPQLGPPVKEGDVVAPGITIGPGGRPSATPSASSKPPVNGGPTPEESQSPLDTPSSLPEGPPDPPSDFPSTAPSTTPPACIPEFAVEGCTTPPTPPGGLPGSGGGSDSVDTAPLPPPP